MKHANYMLYMPALLLLNELLPTRGLVECRDLLKPLAKELERGGGAAGFGTGTWVLISDFAALVTRQMGVDGWKHASGIRMDAERKGYEQGTD